MKLRIHTNVDIEAEVSVDLDDVLAECGRRQEEAAADYWRRMLEAVGTMLRIMAAIPDDVIAELPDNACATIRRQLNHEADRYVRRNGRHHRVPGEDNERTKRPGHRHSACMPLFYGFPD